MELKDRKALNNGLPRFDLGKEFNPRPDLVKPKEEPLVSKPISLDPIEITGRGNIRPKEFNINMLNNGASSMPDSNIVYKRAQKTAHDIDKKYDGKGLTAANVANVITTGIDFAGQINDAFTLELTEGLLFNEAGINQRYGSGFAYLGINNINAQKYMDEEHKLNINNTIGTMGKGAAFGAAVGSIFPGPGTVIGTLAGTLFGGALGLFGGGSRHAKLRKRLFNAQLRINRTNDYNLATAQGDYLNEKYYLDNGYTQDDQLYLANKGKTYRGSMILSQRKIK